MDGAREEEEVGRTSLCKEPFTRVEDSKVESVVCLHCDVGQERTEVCFIYCNRISRSRVSPLRSMYQHILSIAAEMFGLSGSWISRTAVNQPPLFCKVHEEMGNLITFSTGKCYSEVEGDAQLVPEEGNVARRAADLSPTRPSFPGV